MSKDSKTELRAYVFIDCMQPQFAAYEGTVVSGDVPVVNMAELFIEIAPGNDIFRVADVAIKAANVRPGSMVVEREFGFLELHSSSQAEVLASGQALLDALGLTEDDRVVPSVASTQVITNIDPYQATLINRFGRGSMLVPGETLYVLEVFPAAYITLAANEAEKAANIKLIEMSAVGRFGRLFLSGSEAEALEAKKASLAALEAISGSIST